MTTYPDDAACYDLDQEIFFSSKRSTVALAKRVCRVCPVRTDCLDEALTVERDLHYRFGVWGGTTPDERRQITRGGAA